MIHPTPAGGVVQDDGHGLDRTARIATRPEDRTECLEIGLIAEAGTIAPGNEDLYLEAARFRTQVYLHEGFVTGDELDSSGTDLSEADRRSSHFVVRATMSGAGKPSMIGSMRLIHKGSDLPLPVELMCPDAFPAPLPPTSIEVSRLISRPGDPRLQSLVKWPLFLAGLEWVERHGLGPVVGLLTESLTRSLSGQGVPIMPMVGARFIPEINANKMPTKIDVAGLREHFASRGASELSLALGEFKSITFSGGRMSTSRSRV